MKAILMSIKEQHNRNIEAGEKTSELRKRAPKCVYPIKVYTYESGFGGRHKVVNEWICKDVTGWRICMGVPAHLPKVACVSIAEICEYSGKNYDDISEMKISDLKIYDKPKELWEFSRYGYKKIEHTGSGYVFCDNTQCGYCEPAEAIAGLYKPPVCRKGGCKVTRPPQSWMYVEEIEE